MITLVYHSAEQFSSRQTPFVCRPPVAIFSSTVFLRLCYSAADSYSLFDSLFEIASSVSLNLPISYYFSYLRLVCETSLDSWPIFLPSIISDLEKGLLYF